MRNDVSSNYLVGVVLSAYAGAIGAHNSTAVKHSKGSSASFIINVLDNGTGGTVDAKLQFLADDGVTWTDYHANDPMGNDSSIPQLTTEGNATLEVVNARGAQSRVVVTIGTDECAVSVVSVLGPLRSMAV